MIDTKTQLFQACHSTKRIKNARIYANRLFLHKIEQEKLQRKALGLFIAVDNLVICQYMKITS
jgi:hypothetical protein